MCTYCCVINLKTCSLDMRACNPVVDREFEQLAYMFLFIFSIVCGCPIFAKILMFAVTFKCMKVSNFST